MKSKKFFTIVSGSALASGMAHGAVLYSGPINGYLPCATSFPSTGDQFDLNNDGLLDFTLGFDGYSAPNDQKPYIVGYPSSFPGSTVLSRYSSANSSYGLPVTLFGSLIDSNYLAPTPASFNVYFDLDGGAHSVGDFVAGAITEGYVGLELWDSTGSTNNYGWARVIYDAVDSPKSLTLVDYAYETTPFEGIIAGATNEVGVPDIYIQPQSQTNGIGAGVQFSVTFLASPAPTLQWQVGPASGTGPYTNLSDVGIISGSTNATLTLNGATSGYQGDYRVVISNSLGAVTSTPAALTLVSPVVSPSAPVLLAGSTASFQVSVTGGLTPTFQWQMDGTNLSNGGRISGATTANLHIGNLQTTDAGSYDVILNFGSSPSPSAISVLTVVPGSQENLYDQAVMADSPSVYYRLNETGNPTNGNLIAYDNVGGFNGTYGIDVTNGYAGVGGPDASNGFPGLGISNSAVQISPTDTNSWITLPPWNLNSANVTFTAWVNPTAITNALSGIIMTGTTNGTFAGMELAITTNDLGTFSFGYQWDEGPGNGEGESPWFQSGLIMPTNEWSMVALAITSSNATLYMFDAEGTNVSVDDSSSPNQYFDANGSTNQVMPFNTPEYIGADPNGGSFGSQNFTGMIDNVAVFNQTMTADQLGTLYSAALGVYNPPPPQISTAGSNIVLTWPIGTLLQSTSLLGPWTTNSSAGSPYTVAPTGISMFYKVVVP